MEKLGEDQYNSYMYVSERLVGQQSQSRIPSRGTTLLYSAGLQSVRNPGPYQKLSLKSDCSLFPQLYIIPQMRNGNLDEFFEHKNQACPPSLPQMGKLRTSTKSDLLGYLEDLVPSQGNLRIEPP